MEGIEVDLNNKIVKFTDENEDYVDTSLNNPSVSDKAISIFKRKKDITKLVSDGNPLVYALKGIKGWSIPQEDVNNLWERIDDVLNKIPNEFDVVVMPESNSGLVSLFAEHVSKRFNDLEILRECLLKRTLEEVIDDINWVDFNEDERNQITDAFKKMNIYFESKYFPKQLADRFEASIYKTSKDSKALNIMNKRVLMLDDVVSSGMTLSHCANVLKHEYFPKSITNIVLFSEV
jgi:phosphoribosylpyrophosphate synthetase